MMRKAGRTQGLSVFSSQGLDLTSCWRLDFEANEDFSLFKKKF